MGLHRCRRPNPASGCNFIDVETSRRTFWNAYSLDNYLCIALGRPRIFHDDDIDQELPSCADDADIFINGTTLTSSACAIMLAPVAYFK